MLGTLDKNDHTIFIFIHLALKEAIKMDRHLKVSTPEEGTEGLKKGAGEERRKKGERLREQATKELVMTPGSLTDPGAS